MTVARAAQDEVEAVRREMQEKVKAAQETADRQVSVTAHSAMKWYFLVWEFELMSEVRVLTFPAQERDQLDQLQELQRELMSSRVELESLKTTMTSSQQVTFFSLVFWVFLNTATLAKICK